MFPERGGDSAGIGQQGLIPFDPPIPNRSPRSREGIPAIPGQSPVRPNRSPDPPLYREDQGRGRSDSWLLSKLMLESMVGLNRLGETAHLRPHKCGEIVYAGLADAWESYVDPIPLTQLGEIEALRQGRYTFSLWSGQLGTRNQWSVAIVPSHEHHVMPEHRCGDPIPWEWRLPPPPVVPVPLKARDPLAKEGFPF